MCEIGLHSDIQSNFGGTSATDERMSPREYGKFDIINYLPAVDHFYIQSQARHRGLQKGSSCVHNQPEVSPKGFRSNDTLRMGVSLSTDTNCLTTYQDHIANTLIITMSCKNQMLREKS